MFRSEKKTITNTWEQTLGHAVCDRCGRVMDQENRESGYNNLALLRFRAGYGSRFGDGNLVEGDFCDGCLFDLMGRYVRVIEDRDVPESDDVFRADSPRRLYAEYQMTQTLAQNVLMLMKDWLEQNFSLGLPRRRLNADADDSTMKAKAPQSGSGA
jgi:hypothetical protein